ncbi:MAG: hypothetical protein CM15mP120_22000 [Pseudomonadota bacterium]|nr:MAG: hypothetical protein CM15mP120_22000 [Pseudomonadota bacterium]
MLIFECLPPRPHDLSNNASILRRANVFADGDCTAGQTEWARLTVQALLLVTEVRLSAAGSRSLAGSALLQQHDGRSNPVSTKISPRRRLGNPVN